MALAPPAARWNTFCKFTPRIASPGKGTDCSVPSRRAASQPGPAENDATTVALPTCRTPPAAINETPMLQVGGGAVARPTRAGDGRSNPSQSQRRGPGGALRRSLLLRGAEPHGACSPGPSWLVHVGQAGQATRGGRSPVGLGWHWAAVTSGEVRYRRASRSLLRGQSVRDGRGGERWSGRSAGGGGHRERAGRRRPIPSCAGNEQARDTVGRVKKCE